MKRSIIRFALLFTFLLPFVGLQAQDPVKDKVVQAMKTGNSKDLADHFIPNLDLTVLDASDVYSKAQAEQILRKFFNEHPPLDLAIEHSGVSKFGDKYFIGILKTKDAQFRTTFFLKKTGEEFQVKQLRIEPSKNDF
ncbi:MAG: DUF4783 domain-containing protein [Flavobacteriales bacterium]|nr:DUF4783 domain-containing protein [Flavobacteriales bacterium]MBK6946392.1 DUF4783 domain-containing protein [Flavobacteriales bacterium]MBK7238650.1 DUF4783 domain-containing protein [Flavobacteriales bacterium]MBK7298013.1 DUF4783 domain-containing protein [Flavobacteriales bacterium]MBK9536441.1 DUF4783 domain-containing protein [Flavobacteriales bacterium]